LKSDSRLIDHDKSSPRPSGRGFFLLPWMACMPEMQEHFPAAAADCCDASPQPPGRAKYMQMVYAPRELDLRCVRKTLLIRS
jgi:hypothetical protein